MKNTQYVYKLANVDINDSIIFYKRKYVFAFVNS
jgi:hypothetical protein